MFVYNLFNLAQINKNCWSLSVFYVVFAKKFIEYLHSDLDYFALWSRLCFGTQANLSRAKWSLLIEEFKARIMSNCVQGQNN